MKLNKLLQVRRVLSEHANEPIPTMLAYKILKFMKSSDTEGAFYDAKLQEIIEQYVLYLLFHTRGLHTFHTFA